MTLAGCNAGSPAVSTDGSAAQSISNRHPVARLYSNRYDSSGSTTVWEFKGTKDLTVRLGDQSLRLQSTPGDMRLTVATATPRNYDRATNTGSVGFSITLTNGRNDGTAESQGSALLNMSALEKAGHVLEVPTSQWSDLPVGKPINLASGLAGFPGVTVQVRS